MNTATNTTTPMNDNELRSWSKERLALLLPVYNPGSELVMTLDSLRAQTIPYKLFVTDDGSKTKPDYHALLDGFDYELIELEQNVGVCTVRNRSIDLALEQGYEFLAMMDSGDYAYPSRLEKQLRFLIENPEVGLLGTAMEIFDDDMNYVHDYVPASSPSDVRRSLYYSSCIPHPTMMYRAETLRKIGRYTDKYDVAEDYEICRRAAQVTELANLPEVLFRYFQTTSSTSNKRRTAGLVSRLRIQWAYRNLSELHCWLGLLKSIVVLVTPTSWVKRVQPFIYGKRATDVVTKQLNMDA